VSLSPPVFQSDNITLGYQARFRTHRIKELKTTICAGVVAVEFASVRRAYQAPVCSQKLISRKINIVALVRTLRPNVKHLALTFRREGFTFFSDRRNSLILNWNEFSGTTVAINRDPVERKLVGASQQVSNHRLRDGRVRSYERP
jgi:hypothetical protein